MVNRTNNSSNETLEIVDVIIIQSGVDSDGGSLGVHPIKMA
jgi:hypothetical protein